MATRVEAMAKARAVKTEKVKHKIQGAINILNLYGVKITVRAVASESGVATSTVQKYLPAMKPKEKIKIDQVEKEIDRKLLLNRLSKRLSALLNLNIKKDDQRCQIKESLKWFLIMEDLLKDFPEFEPENWQQQRKEWKEFFKPAIDEETQINN